MWSSITPFETHLEYISYRNLGATENPNSWMAEWPCRSQPQNELLQDTDIISLDQLLATYVEVYGDGDYQEIMEEKTFTQFKVLMNTLDPRQKIFGFKSIYGYAKHNDMIVVVPYDLATKISKRTCKHTKVRLEPNFLIHEMTV